MSDLIELLVSAIFETTSAAVIKLLGMEDVVEFVSSIFGLACIVGGLGYAIWGQ